MSGSGPLTLFGGKRCCEDRKFVVSKKLKYCVVRETMTESGLLTLFDGKRYCENRKFAVSKVFSEDGVVRENMKKKTIYLILTDD